MDKSTNKLSVIAAVFSLVMIVKFGFLIFADDPVAEPIYLEPDVPAESVVKHVFKISQEDLQSNTVVKREIDGYRIIIVNKRKLPPVTLSSYAGPNSQYYVGVDLAKGPPHGDCGLIVNDGFLEEDGCGARLYGFFGQPFAHEGKPLTLLNFELDDVGNMTVIAGDRYNLVADILKDAGIPDSYD